jgi:maltooligosyltrehalose trehalohydrolase
LRWSELDEPAHASMHEWYRDLLALRRERPELSDPRPTSTGVDEHDSEHTLVMWRGDTAVAANTDSSPAHVSLDGTAGKRMLLASDGDIHLTEDGVVLAPNSVVVVGR